ncbi:MAG TPA: type VI secretion system tube protein TssD [Candidatus Angelobacter sp.]|nr:type VI secretion system tube protein TssD [Candidatus Angelobacter sp.]
MRLRTSFVLLVLAALTLYCAMPPQKVAARPPVNGQFGPAAGSSCRVSIRGQTQGQFAGTAGPRPEPGIVCTQFLMAINSPRDAASGMPSGKRLYSPITITKAWDAASPQIMKAASSNESLPLVEFQFSRANSSGGEAVFETIRLTNATITTVKRYIGFPDAGEPSNPRPQEDVAFTFQKIEINNSEGKTGFSDDWNSPR